VRYRAEPGNEKNQTQAGNFILEFPSDMSKQYKLRIPRSIYEAMLQQARAELPNECCGLLAGLISEDGVGHVSRQYPLANDLASPVRYQSYPFAAHKAMRAEQIDLLAVYHSHPTSEPVPSRTDCAQNYYGPDTVHLIISLKDGVANMRAWRLAESNFEEAKWEFAEDA
jgi:proteasome lid subunit RPN8/RPN11